MKFFPVVILLAVWLCWSFPVYSFGGSTAELQQLAFGVLDINGAAPQQVVVDPDGDVHPDAGIIVLHKGLNGRYRLYAYDPALLVSLTIADTTLDLFPAGTPSFDIIDFTFDPDGVDQVTDGSGELIVKIGATLVTRPATTYLPGPYRGTYTLMINF